MVDLTVLNLCACVHVYKLITCCDTCQSMKTFSSSLSLLCNSFFAHLCAFGMKDYPQSTFEIKWVCAFTLEFWLKWLLNLSFIFDSFFSGSFLIVCFNSPLLLPPPPNFVFRVRPYALHAVINICSKSH